MVVNCPKTIRTEGFYCGEDRAYSGLVQSGSRVRVENLSTGKSATLAVFRREGLEGVCLPESLRSLLGPGPFPARLHVERCGVDDRKTCPVALRGLASYYGEPYHGRRTPYGVNYDMHGYYAASPDLPLGSLLRVRNTKNGREVTVKVVDRGPFKGGRVLDLSYRAAVELQMIGEGLAEVEVQVLRCGD